MWMNWEWKGQRQPRKFKHILTWTCICGSPCWVHKGALPTGERNLSASQLTELFTSGVPKSGYSYHGHYVCVCIYIYILYIHTHTVKITFAGGMGYNYWKGILASRLVKKGFSAKLLQAQFYWYHSPVCLPFICPSWALDIRAHHRVFSFVLFYCTIWSAKVNTKVNTKVN